MSERPFRVLGVQQIAVGAADRTSLRRFWVDLMGFTPAGTYRSERENVDEEITTVGVGAARVEVDLMQPIDPTKSPRVHEPALNHLGLWIDDLPAAVQWLGEQGVRFTPGGIRRGASGFDVCFVHPKGNVDAPRSAAPNTTRGKADPFRGEPLDRRREVVDPEADVVERGLVDAWTARGIDRLHEVDLDAREAEADAGDVFVDVLALASVVALGMEPEQVDPEGT